jgi:hypothetical protein
MKSGEIEKYHRSSSSKTETSNFALILKRERRAWNADEKSECNESANFTMYEHNPKSSNETLHFEENDESRRLLNSSLMNHNRMT